MGHLSGITVAFDLDGTLVDTAPDLAASLNAVLVEEGLPAMNIDVARVYVGQGAAVLLERGFAAAGRVLDEADKTRLVARFIAVYRARMCDGSAPYPHVIETLTALKTEGVILVVCTNKLTELSNELLQGLGLDHFFTCVMGQDTAPARKPDPRHLIAAITTGGGDPVRAVMVGDSEADLLAARNAGIPCALFMPGYGAEAASILNPEARFEDYRDLLSLIAALVK